MEGNGYGAHEDFVIDAVLHAYNFSDENFKNELAQSFAGLSYGLILTTGDEGLISPEQHRRNWSNDELAEITFVESDVDMAVHHGVPLDDYFYDGLSSNEKARDMHLRWPNRVQWYVGINPLEGAGSAGGKATEAVTEHGAIGAEVLPGAIQRGQGGRAHPLRRSVHGAAAREGHRVGGPGRRAQVRSGRPRGHRPLPHRRRGGGGRPATRSCRSRSCTRAWPSWRRPVTCSSATPTCGPTWR